MVNYALIADIGGTNSNFALAEFDINSYRIIDRKDFLTKNCTNFTKIISDLLSEFENKDIKIEIAVFSIAAKIIGNRVKLTNCDLTIDSDEIIKKTNLKKVKLLNDFEVLAYSVEVIEKDKLVVINEGIEKNKKPKIILGAGTGFGHSLLIYDEQKGYLPVKSEGGHGDFAPSTDQEFQLEKFIEEKYARSEVEWEDVLSGRGIENIYEFLSGKRINSKDISELKKEDEEAKKAFDIFYRFYARAAKNLALEVLSEGGVYLAGGIICKNPEFDRVDFIKEFINNFNFHQMLIEMPIYMIKDYNISLDGIANYVLKERISFK